MDTINIFTEDTDLNIVKSWLCNATGGQTYPFKTFLKRIMCPLARTRFNEIEDQWNDLFVHQHCYKVDDPNLDRVAADMLNRIKGFIEDVDANPQKYFAVKGSFSDNDGYAYVCVEETPEYGKDVICVKTDSESAKRWVDTRKTEIEGAIWNHTTTSFEYSIWDENAANGWYAFRTKMD